MAEWRRSDSAGLSAYLLCLLLQQARFEATLAGPAAVATSGFLALPQLERETLVLLERAGLDASTVAEMLVVPVDEVTRIQSRAHARLAGSTDGVP